MLLSESSMLNDTDYDLHHGNETLNANHVHVGAARYAVAVLLVLVYFAVLLANYGIIYYEWVSFCDMLCCGLWCIANNDY